MGKTVNIGLYIKKPRNQDLNQSKEDYLIDEVADMAWGEKKGKELVLSPTSSIESFLLHLPRH